MPIRVEDVTYLKTSESGKAILCEVDGDEAWVPDSQIEDDSDIWKGSDEGDVGVLVVSNWFARKVGWE